MSLALYQRRLYWDGARGVARSGGVTIELRCAPSIEPILRGLQELDYTPDVRVARVRLSTEAWRDMTLDEANAANQWLKSVAHTALQAANQCDGDTP